MAVTTWSQDPELSGDAGLSPDDGQVGNGCSAAVAEVGRAVGVLPTVLLAELPGAVALADTRMLMVASQQLTAELLRRLSDVQHRQLFALDGAPTIGTWVEGQHVAGIDRQHLALARRLERVPQVGAQLGAGRISVRAAELLARAVCRARPFLDQTDGRIDGQPGEAALYGVLVDGVLTMLANQTGGFATEEQAEGLRAELEALVVAPTSQLCRWEAGLLWLAERLAPELLASALGLLVDALLPAEHDHRAREQEHRTGLELTKNDGSGWLLRGELDEETGELLHTVLTAQAAVDPGNATDTEAYRGAQDSDPELLGELPPPDWPTARARPRSRRQRQHDALTAGLRALLDSGVLGVRGKVRPHLALTVSLDAVHGVPGALPATAMSGARWSRTQLRRVLCDSVFTRLVLGARGRVIECSHDERTLKAYERVIVRVESGGICAISGCSRGPATGDTLIPHHPELYSLTRTTQREDTVPLCEADHHHLHSNQRTLKLKNGYWLGPSGWTSGGN